MQHPNANMATSSNDRYAGTWLRDISAGFSGPSIQPYNNFRVQTLGGNIIQGQINKIRVAEVYFPYDVPTVVAGQNDSLALTFYTQTVGSSPSAAQPYVITLPPGFYTATDMATALQNAINTNGAALAGWPAGTITVTVDPQSSALLIKNTTTYSTTPGAIIYALAWAPYAAGTYGSSSVNNPSLVSTMGFKNYFCAYPPTYNSSLVEVIYPAIVPANYPNNGTIFPVFPGATTAALGAAYSGHYTDYIDICSPTLCQAQFVRDGNTNQNVIHRDIICRLYVANEISVYYTDTTGTRPFIIHRQFKNAKVMKWTAERSIDAIDIQLYDMYGNYLPTSGSSVPGVLSSQQVNSGYRDFAISFLVDEPGAAEQSDNVGYRY